MLTIFNIRPKGYNVGNEAIAIGMRRYIHQVFGCMTNIVSIPATSRYESSSYAGLTPKTVYDINQYGDGVIIGGGNLYENGELEVSLDVLDSLQVPLMLFSLSRGRVYDRRHHLVRRTDTMPDRVLLALHRKACVALARDIATDEYLHSIGCSNSRVGGCPTIFLNQVVNQLPPMSEEDSGVLISIRQPQLMSIPPADQARVYNDICLIINILKDRGYKQIRLLCHDHRDISFAASFPEVSFVYSDNVYHYLALLKNCCLNISYRLHATLPCLSFGVPTIKISYDERAVSLMKTIGYDSYNIKMMETEKTVNAVDDMLDRINEFSEVRRSVEDQWKKLDSTMASGFVEFASVVKDYSKKNIK